MFHHIHIATFSLVLLAMSCTRNQVEECDDATSLHTLADFPIGVAVEPYELQSNSSYSEIVMAQFNRFTPENAFKPSALHPEPGQLSFNVADSLVALALREDKLLHGHTLIWHSQIPYWMETFEGSKIEWIKMMKFHIESIVQHFGDKVASWDVVNEVFEDNGDFRETIWFQNIGEDYLELAFEFAYKANPDALLFYNDYNLTSKSKKCKAILEHLSKLKDDGVPVHGMGLQLHIQNSSPSESAIETAVNAFVEKGFLIHFSEIDISMNTEGDMRLTESKKQKQAKRMQSLVNIFQHIPTEQQFGMTIWGVSDNDSWIPGSFGREDYPLLYDGNYYPKPMYCGFRAGLMD